MFMLPYEIETLRDQRPWMNWVLMGLMVVASFFWWSSADDLEDPYFFLLHDWRPVGLITHLFLHGDLMHLAGNLAIMWVFGNSICSNAGNWPYLFLFLCLGVLAGFAHMLSTEAPALGASGAINGIVGVALAMYPLNQVSIFLLIIVRPVWVTWRLWVLCLLWLAFDLWGALRGTGQVAYFAHLGGLAAGVSLGLLALKQGWLELTQWDNRSLWEILRGERPKNRTWD